MLLTVSIISIHCTEHRTCWWRYLFRLYLLLCYWPIIKWYPHPLLPRILCFSMHTLYRIWFARKKKIIIGFMNFLSGISEMFYCVDKRVFVSFFKLYYWDNLYNNTKETTITCTKEIKVPWIRKLDLDPKNYELSFHKSIWLFCVK